MAPGWLHGCLGLHFAFSRRGWYRQLRYVLFRDRAAAAGALGARLHRHGERTCRQPGGRRSSAGILEPGQRRAAPGARAMAKDNLLNGYFSIIGAAFIAREIRNLIERRSKRLVSVSYPGRIVRVPRGWSVLEASRSFHLPHASMCGGRARCSTCRVRVTAGEEVCPPAANDEQATLTGSARRRTCGWPASCVRRATSRSCRWCAPRGRSIGPTAPQRSAEREVVVLFCDFLNRGELASDHLPQDLLYVLTLYVEGVGNAIRSSRGTLSYVELDSVCALFGHEGGANAAQGALRAAAAIERVIADLNNRLGRQRDCKVKIARQHPRRPRRGRRDRRFGSADADGDRRGRGRGERAAQGRRRRGQAVCHLGAGLRGGRTSNCRRRTRSCSGHLTRLRQSRRPSPPRRRPCLHPREEANDARRCSACGRNEG